MKFPLMLYDKQVIYDREVLILYNAVKTGRILYENMQQRVF